METVLGIALGVGFLVLLMAVSMKISSSRGYLGFKKTPSQYVDESDIRMRR
jgi:hypothetical protein